MNTKTELTRPIIGIENRTAQETFDIMCDRIRTLGEGVGLEWRNEKHLFFNGTGIGYITTAGTKTKSHGYLMDKEIGKAAEPEIKRAEVEKAARSWLSPLSPSHSDKPSCLSETPKEQRQAPVLPNLDALRTLVAQAFRDGSGRYDGYPSPTTTDRIIAEVLGDDFLSPPPSEPPSPINTGEVVAWLKTWRDGRESRIRVDLIEACEPWLEALRPTVHPLTVLQPTPGGEDHSLPSGVMVDREDLQAASDVITKEINRHYGDNRHEVVAEIKNLFAISDRLRSAIGGGNG